MEEHDKEVRMCTSEPVKGTRAKSNGKGEKIEGGKNKKAEKRYPAKTARQERDKPKRLREKETKISCWRRRRKGYRERRRRRRRRGRAMRVEVAAAVEGCFSRAGSANER